MLLVHVAGAADLGIPLIVVGQRRSPEETAELTARRTAELDAARAGEETADLLLGLHFAQEDPGADDAARGAPGSALRKELGALARLAAEPGTSSHDVDILVVGVEGGRTPTDAIARTLVEALRRIPAEICDLVAGRGVRVLDACILPGLHVSQTSIETLEKAIGGHDGHVLLALAGGATTVLAEVAGVVAATHGDEWSLALIDRVGDDQADGGAPILHMSVDGENPLRGWLMGLGLPTVLAEEYDRRRTGAQADADMPDEVRRAAGALRRAVGDDPVTGPIDPEDFAQLLWTDTARGDLAAGMALRAWVAAEYRRRRRQYLDETGLDETEHPDALRKGGELGRTIGRLEEEARARPLAAPEAWLAAQRDFIDLGIGATHRFDRAGDDLRERVRTALGGRPPDWLSWPSGTVCLLSGQGTSRKDRPERRAPIAVALLRAQPDRALRRACSVPGPLRLRTFIACSDESLDEGRDVVDRLAADDPDRHADWQAPEADGATAVSYGPATTSDGVTASGAEESMSRAGRLAVQWLEDQLAERWSRPRAIVVTVVGEKPVVIALLRAAQVFGARHGIAVLLASTVRSADGRNVLQFHQFGLDRDVRRALLRATGYCLDRLDLLTAARLLALGDPAMEGLADEARALADELVKAVQTEDIDGCADVIVGVMDAVGRMIDHVQPDARVRLATIVGELLNPAPESKRTAAFRRPVVLALADGQFDQRKNSVYTSNDVDLAGESAGALLRLLVRVRNKVTINHGSKGLAEATEQVLEHYRRESRCTYARLVELAVAAVGSGSGVGAGDWGRRLDALRERVGTLEKISYG